MLCVGLGCVVLCCAVLCCVVCCVGLCVCVCVMDARERVIERKSARARENDVVMRLLANRVAMTTTDGVDC